MASRLRPSPALVVAMIALFVSIGGVGYAASKIGTNDLQNGAVTAKKLHKKAVTAKKIKKNSVLTNKIADLAVTTEKLNDQSVTTPKIADQAVGTGQIADQAVGTGQIADQAVTNGKLAFDSVSKDKIQDSAVGASELGSTQQVVGTQVAIAANGAAEASVLCPGTTQVLSGGGFADSFGVHLVTSFQSGNGWHVAYQNTTAAAHQIEAIAICINA